MGGGGGSHIAFFSIPALGHVYPSVAVVAELVRRGYRVSYAAVDERAALVEAVGARVLRYRSLRPSDTDPDYAVPEPGAHLGRSLLNFLAEAAATLPQLEPALAVDRPDVVVFDRMAFAGRVFAEKYGVPAVQLWPMMLPGPQWSTADLSPEDRAHPVFREYLARVATFLAGNGLALAPDEFLTPAGARHVAFFPRAFQLGGERFDGSHSFVGPCVGPRPGQPRWIRPGTGRPLLLVTLGSLNNRHPGFYRTCFAAFAGTRWQVVMPVGRRFDPATLGPAPPNVTLAAEVPQLDVLAEADVLVSHAGLGGIMEAVWFGVPHVALPRTAEQELNADRLVHLGLGTRLGADADPAALRAAVERVADDPGLRLGIAAMRDEALAAGGAARAADAIERIAAPAQARTKPTIARA